MRTLSLFHILQASDEIYCGRIGYDSLCQQTLLELVVEELVDEPPFSVDSGRFDDVTTWRGVSCDEKGEVSEIDWSTKWCIFFPRGGVIKIEWLPSSVRVFDIYRNEIDGSVDLSLLPRRLQKLDLSKNRFTGNLNLRQLPHLLEILDLASNSFNGSIELSNLAGALRVLDVSHNKLTGQLKCTNIPANMDYIHLQHNFFHGDLLLDDSACQIPISVYETSINYVGHTSGLVDFHHQVALA